MRMSNLFASKVLLSLSLAFGFSTSNIHGSETRDIINLSLGQAPDLSVSVNEEGSFTLEDPVLGPRTEALKIDGEVIDYDLVYTQRNYGFIAGMDTILYVSLENELQAYVHSEGEWYLLDSLAVPETITDIDFFAREMEVGNVINLRRFVKITDQNNRFRILELNSGEFDLIDLYEFSEVVPLWLKQLENIQTVKQIADGFAVLRERNHFFLDRVESWLFNKEQNVRYYLGQFENSAKLQFDAETGELTLGDGFKFYVFNANVLQGN